MTVLQPRRVRQSMERKRNESTSVILPSFLFSRECTAGVPSLSGYLNFSGAWLLSIDSSLVPQGMKDRGHNRDPKQRRVKLKELRQAYQKTRDANGRSGTEPQTCRFYDELHAILGGSATTTPAMLFDSFNGDGGNTEAGFGDKEDDDDEEEVVDSSQQASGETGFPDSQELFLTLDLEPVPPEPTQGCLPDPPGGEGTSAACVSRITGSSPS
ncbi:uncharacterized protein LOC142070762 [Caretta caretta]|uniref:uncharacterized protein LOC142070762 n=1 Tax=Caretta caretta TaxID=8467 RepID=UPI003F4B15EE